MAPRKYLHQQDSKGAKDCMAMARRPPFDTISGDFLDFLESQAAATSTADTDNGESGKRRRLSLSGPPERKSEEIISEEDSPSVDVARQETNRDAVAGSTAAVAISCASMSSPIANVQATNDAQLLQFLARMKTNQSRNGALSAAAANAAAQTNISVTTRSPGPQEDDNTATVVRPNLHEPQTTVQEALHCLGAPQVASLPPTREEPDHATAAHPYLPNDNQAAGAAAKKKIRLPIRVVTEPLLSRISQLEEVVSSQETHIQNLYALLAEKEAFIKSILSRQKSDEEDGKMPVYVTLADETVLDNAMDCASEADEDVAPYSRHKKRKSIDPSARNERTQVFAGPPESGPQYEQPEAACALTFTQTQYDETLMLHQGNPASRERVSVNLESAAARDFRLLQLLRFYAPDAQIHAQNIQQMAGSAGSRAVQQNQQARRWSQNSASEIARSNEGSRRAKDLALLSSQASRGKHASPTNDEDTHGSGGRGKKRHAVSESVSVESNCKGSKGGSDATKATNCNTGQSGTPAEESAGKTTGNEIGGEEEGGNGDENLREHDVLFGVGRIAYTHPGNQWFRKMIKENKTRYQTTSLRSIKSSIITAIMTQVSSKGGRFLRKMSKDGVESGWNPVTDEEAYEKVCHALRTRAANQK